ncbi:hypothetical protein BWQ96_05894 [Gracilariopsis chorda]|uniref:Uncharacterized protein n=1 Tax=Gracilariopsis chorda TaxID=448386 RepID=A0A2V3IT89_9FLOR|nr:hypothetical protein BWQ96_05894 [Gracilariopsis chorda]|eukprot:PXF44330.1 hypothetical protein BWQ96_05894 [Gracilariopsis chorda]
MELALAGLNSVRSLSELQTEILLWGFDGPEGWDLYLYQRQITRGETMEQRNKAQSGINGPGKAERGFRPY